MQSQMCYLLECLRQAEEGQTPIWESEKSGSWYFSAKKKLFHSVLFKIVKIRGLDYIRAKFMSSSRLQQFQQRTKQDSIQLSAKLWTEQHGNAF